MSGRRTCRDLGPLVGVLLLVAAAFAAPRWKGSTPGLLAVLFDVSASVGTEARQRAAGELKETLRGLSRRTTVADALESTTMFSWIVPTLGLCPVTPGVCSRLDPGLAVLPERRIA